VGFGAEILFVMLLGLVLLGPKRMHAMLGQVARVKAQFEEATLGLKSELSSELDADSDHTKTEGAHDSSFSPREQGEFLR
jgi:Sec-independent protein translocase protein TatA